MKLVILDCGICYYTKICKIYLSFDMHGDQFTLILNENKGKYFYSNLIILRYSIYKLKNIHLFGVSNLIIFIFQLVGLRFMEHNPLGI